MLYHFCSCLNNVLLFDIFIHVLVLFPLFVLARECSDTAVPGWARNGARRQGERERERRLGAKGKGGREEGKERGISGDAGKLPRWFLHFFTHCDPLHNCSNCSMGFLGPLVL